MARDRDPDRSPREGAEGRGPDRREASDAGPDAVPDAGEDPRGTRRRSERTEEERHRAAGAGRGRAAEANESRRLSGRDVRRLVFATYRASLPYFLVFLLVMALATWFVTEVLF